MLHDTKQSRGGVVNKAIFLKGKLAHSFDQIISIENLLEAWQEFFIGKSKKADVQEFQIKLMDHLILLHRELVNHTYRHGGYQAFRVNDPKPRNIHKASVRDRLVHHAIYRILYPYFDRHFIADSFSCRNGKGTHKALNRFRSFARKVSINHTRTCWVLKLDIQKFFANIDQEILLGELNRSIDDGETLWLLKEILDSFFVTRPGIGLPLGNLTSQLFANVYLNQLDQFVKQTLRFTHYIRYADDFVLLSADWPALLGYLSSIDLFLQKKLHLCLHPNKIYLSTICSGIDFLGWTHFSDHRILRQATARRMMRKVVGGNKQVFDSYLGLLSHGNTRGLQHELLKMYLH